MVGVTELLRLDVALSRASGTVTALLEELVGEPIDAHDRHNKIIRAGSTNFLRVAEGCPLIFRTATLQGRTSGQSYVYAETVFVASRLSSSFRLRLESSSDPIGRILEAEGITVTRESLGEPDHAPVSLEGAIAIRDYLRARTYRVDVEGTPLMVIAEWFLIALKRFLPSQ
jgi:chorismate-pyruvate lyase